MAAIELKRSSRPLCRSTPDATRKFRYVRWCSSLHKEMRGNILKKIYDVPCMKYETRMKVQKVK
jgi:hypothetical protein